MDYEKNTEELLKEIKNRKAKKILLQIPEGLKTRAVDIAERIERIGTKVIISGEPCYGACDLRDREAKMLGCDLLVHVGHSKFFKDFKEAVPVLYFPWKIDISLDVDFTIIKEKEITIASTIQHLHLLEELKERLEKQGKKVTVLGQILGCYLENSDKVGSSVILVLGSGYFHATGIRDKAVYRLSPETKTIEKMDTMLGEKKRFANIAKAREAKSFCILVSLKPGQFYAKAEEIKRVLEEKDKKACILIMDEIRAEKLLGYKFDAYINTACKRITDDSFDKPMINKEDIDLVIS